MKNLINLIVINWRLAVSSRSAAVHLVSVENSTTTSGQRARAFLRCFLLAIGALAALWAAVPVRAQVLPPSGTYYGKTYGQWEETYCQWFFSLPATGHPFVNPADAFVGQTGPVWFLTGSPNLANLAPKNLVHYGTIPGGTALFIDLVDAWCDNTDCNGSRMISDGLAEAQLRAVSASFLQKLDSLSCTIDGVAVAGLADLLTSPYHLLSPTPGGFSYTVPGTNNMLEYFGVTCWTNNTGAPITVDASIYHPVDEGYYLLLAPLPPGQHTIYEHAQAGTPPIDVYSTWYLTVQPLLLSIAQRGTNVVISWPQTASTNVLESTSSLESASWSSVAATNQAVGDTYEVTLPVGPGNQFFRLRQSP